MAALQRAGSLLRGFGATPGPYWGVPDILRIRDSCRNLTTCFKKTGDHHARPQD
jgi:hypothetical protein